MSEFKKIRDRVRLFAEDRDWEQFHSPKNLAMALSAEVGELVEHFQWLTEDQSRSIEPETLAEIADEIADVQIYLIRLADKLEIDIPSSVAEKIEKNEGKYPADRVKGDARKYTKYKSNNENDG